MKDCRTCANLYLEYQYFCAGCDPDYSNWESMYPDGRIEDKDDEEYIYKQNISWDNE